MPLAPGIPDIADGVEDPHPVAPLAIRDAFTETKWNRLQSLAEFTAETKLRPDTRSWRA